MDLKAKILAAKKKMIEVPIPDWDFKVFVRRMTSNEREIFIAEESKPENDWLKQQRLMVSMCLCDEAGERVFNTPDDLKDIDTEIIDTLSAAVSDLSGASKDAKDDVKKKSASAENSGSNSTLPGSSDTPAAAN